MIFFTLYIIYSENEKKLKRDKKWSCIYMVYSCCFLIVQVSVILRNIILGMESAWCPFEHRNCILFRDMSTITYFREWVLIKARFFWRKNKSNQCFYLLQDLCASSSFLKKKSYLRRLVYRRQTTFKAIARIF